jgi:sterol 3beta-glucosyltransferase
MKIAILTLGSRGDAQPYLALAVGMQRAGHQVTMAVPARSTAWVQAYGVNTHLIRFDLESFVQKPEIRAILNGRDIFRQLAVMRGEMRYGMLKVLADFWSAVQTADFVVASSIGYGAAEAASQRGLPVAYAFVAPFTPPTRSFPSFLLPVRASLGGSYNALTYPLMLRAIWPVFSGPLNEWRSAKLGLPPWRSINDLLRAQNGPETAWMYGFSPNLLPKPLDWDDRHHVAGYWFLDAPPAWQPTAELLRFLEAGPPPVYVGFGSMRQNDPEGRTRLVLRALELSGQRGVLLTGTLTRGAAAPNMFYVDDVPHDWLFPRMAVVVHHGGAGTTAAGLRAGVPSLITPFIGDQYAWAEQVEKMSVGPRVGANKKLTAEKLAQAIHRATEDTGMRARAAALGEKIRAENGVANAVNLIEQHAFSFKQRLATEIP